VQGLAGKEGAAGVHGIASPAFEVRRVMETAVHVPCVEWFLYTQCSTTHVQANRSNDALTRAIYKCLGAPVLPLILDFRPTIAARSNSPGREGWKWERALRLCGLCLLCNGGRWRAGAGDSMIQG